MQVIIKFNDVTKLNAGSFEWLPRYSKKEYIEIQNIHITMVKRNGKLQKRQIVFRKIALAGQS